MTEGPYVNEKPWENDRVTGSDGKYLILRHIPTTSTPTGELEVIHRQGDLVEVVAKLKQVVCVKG